MSVISSMCVFCGSSAGDDPIYSEEARKLGKLLAESDIKLVYGGGHVGIMGAVAEGALESNGMVHGIIPGHLDEREETFFEIPELEIVPHMYTRKNRMKEVSDSFCLMAGGFGSLDEIYEIMVLRQLNRIDKPLIIANTNGFWDEFIALNDKIFNSKFAREEHRSLYVVVEKTEDIIPAAEEEMKKILAKK